MGSYPQPRGDLPVGPMATDKLTDVDDYGLNRRAKTIAEEFDGFGWPPKDSQEEFEQEELLSLIAHLSLRAVRHKKSLAARRENDEFDCL